MTGQTWARVGFITGIAASIAANVGHAYLSPAPAVGAIVSAAFWPIALLISIEVIARVEWPAGWSWRLIRYGGLTTVAAIAAIISYQHMAALLMAYGEQGISAALGPLAVDGLMAVSSGALLAIGQSGTDSAGTYSTTDELIDKDINVPINGVQVAARKAYLDSVEANKPLTGKELGEQFQRSARWGRNMIREARRQP